MRLALGCAQLGMPYGPHPRTPSYPRAREIIGAAWEEGIRFFDTAQAYGESEAYLGKAIRELGIVGAKVITKLRLGDDPLVSRARLGWNISHVLSHGWIGLDGASVHEPDEALEAIKELSAIQVPASAFDRRMERAGVFDRARELGRTVFVRSILLRGEMFGLTAYRDFCEQNGLDMHRFAIEYALERTGGILVIGAEDAEQVRQNAEAVRNAQSPTLAEEWDRIWQEDIELVRK